MTTDFFKEYGRSCSPNDAMVERNTRIIIDLVRPFHEYAEDEGIDMVLAVEFEGLEPNTLASLAEALKA
jgi:hypothetical protein